MTVHHGRATAPVGRREAADAVRQAASALNNAVLDAQNLGLRVDVVLEDEFDILRKLPRRIVRVGVYERI